MFEEYQICPYTGLRSFTEEESLYFKGREEHIEQATEQLQRNKFLMLTGASGDGKSSLIYAGIIPNARSGFLKAKYTRWCVADFRPERTPFINLCHSVAEQLEIANPQIVESELQHGFSALVDLYRNSRRYIDVDSEEWLNADDKEKATMKREAGNLLILVDQFEEFFTNPENYRAGVASVDSELVLNVLLETARIALEEDLPIYIVFTMRSDYIGQCAAFRGLPEYIGFSQFFVPRLNRSQLQQVIEEPATLSGNKITRRLSERLIHDIIEGVDQLPILQHTLNQVWVAASNGEEEMDLIHYAMVGGMKVDELPEDQVGRFTEWFNKLPLEIKECYHGQNLQNVLDTHTNKLFEQAASYFQAQTGKEIQPGEAKTIIKTVFTCLTKIDQSRAVRNRMTLDEIVSILNNPTFGPVEVGAVINLFREPGNTFIRPFISEDDAKKELAIDQVLDITHESLIRNWKYLDEWAKEEYANHAVFVDFAQQLNRWVDSGKSGNFLLSIGPLTYFENWYQRVKPNPAWIARYQPEDSDKETNLKKARAIHQIAQEFLSRSALSHAVTRTVMRYGARRIVTFFAVLISVVFLSFIGVDYYQRQNSFIIDNLGGKIDQLVADPNTEIRTRAWLICEELKLGITTIEESVSDIKNPMERINVSNGIATAMVYYGRRSPETLILTSLNHVSGILDGYTQDSLVVADYHRLLKETNDFSRTLELAYYYNPTPVIDSLRLRNARRSADYVSYLLTNQPAGFTAVAGLNIALEFALMYQTIDKDQVSTLTSRISPFEATPTAWMSENYSRGKLALKGFFESGLNFNGLYQELAYMYAATGQPDLALRAVDTVLKYNQNYVQNDYAYFPDNAYHIAAYFFRYNNLDALDQFVAGYCRKVGLEAHEFYARLVARSKLYEFASTSQDMDPDYGHDVNLILDFSSVEQLTFFFAKHREVINGLSNADERNYLLALSYKDEAINQYKRLKIQGRDSLTRQYVNLFNEAINRYRAVSEAYKMELISIIDLTNNDFISVPRKFIFLFPDIKNPFHPNELRLFHFNYTSDSFLEYVLDNGVFDELYPTNQERRIFELLLRDFSMIKSDLAYQVTDAISYKVLKQLEAELSSLEGANFANINLLYLELISAAAQNGEGDKAVEYAQKVSPDKVPANFLNSFDESRVFRFFGEAVVSLAGLGEKEEAYKIVNLFEGETNRSTLYAYAAIELMRNGVASREVDYLIDSAKLEMNRIENRIGGPNRVLLAYVLALRGGKDDVDEAYEIIRNQGAKWVGIRRICAALAFRGDLYRAVQNIPSFVSDPDYSTFAWFILNGYNEGINDQSLADWSTYDANLEKTETHPIRYVDDNN